MISKHSAHSTLLPIGFRTWLWRYTCLLLLISMLWHRQTIFESKGDRLSSSAEGRIRTQGLRYLFTSRLNACWQTDWAIEDQAKKLELDSPSLWSASIQPTRPYCQLAFILIWMRHQSMSLCIGRAHLCPTYAYVCVHVCMYILYYIYTYMYTYTNNYRRFQLLMSMCLSVVGHQQIQWCIQ